MQTVTTPDSKVPWGTVALAAGNVVVFVLAGSAPDYPGAAAGGERDLPSIGRLMLDTLRHPNVLVLALTLGALVPAATAVERLAAPAGLLAAYLVAGFAGGFIVVLASTDGMSVVGAFGGSTALLTMWLVIRWRADRQIGIPLLVILGWFWGTFSLRGNLPPGAAAVSIWIGLYACGAVGHAARRRRQTGRE